MQLLIFSDYRSLSERAAEEMVMQIKQKPDSLLCLASGSTPMLTYELFVRKARKANIDFSSCSLIGLDEWVGISSDNKGSCACFFKEYILDHLNIKKSLVHFFNGLSSELNHECVEMDRVIFAAGGIDLMVVGIGMNGHIGFNEPGVSPDLYSHVVSLAESTISVGQKYFVEPTTLQLGITLGLKHLLESRKVVLLANGEKKAAIIQKTLEGNIHPSLPATIVRRHQNSLVLIDDAAAASLSG